MPANFIGWFPTVSGVNFAFRAAATDAACNNGCPLIDAALITFPSSSTTILTSTLPDARAARAMGGYAGLGRLTALTFAYSALEKHSLKDQEGILLGFAPELCDGSAETEPISSNESRNFVAMAP